MKTKMTNVYESYKKRVIQYLSLTFLFSTCPFPQEKESITAYARRREDPFKYKKKVLPHRATATAYSPSITRALQSERPAQTLLEF